MMTRLKVKMAVIFRKRLTTQATKRTVTTKTRRRASVRESP